MNKDQINDIIEWDIINWSKAIPFWEKHANISNTTNLKCLELGGRKGGLSLWLALNGHQVICSDLHSPEKDAKPKHLKHKVENKVKYQAISATNIPFNNELDVITFKSILGGICRNGNDELKKEIINEIYKSLKPGGNFIFSENLTSSFLHQFFRKKFTNWGAEWNYLNYSEIEPLFSQFKKLNYTTVGFWGAFGRNEKQRNFFGKIDNWFEKIIPNKMHYIVIGVAEK